MDRILEIESALKKLPPEKRLEIAHRLLADLQQDAPGEFEGGAVVKNVSIAPPVPDYAARRRRIFGDKVIPNMVLCARADERW